MKHRSSAVELERYFTHWITSGRTVGKASFSTFALTSPLITRFMIVYHLFMFKFLELLQRRSKALMLQMNRELETFPFRQCTAGCQPKNMRCILMQRY